MSEWKKGAFRYNKHNDTKNKGRTLKALLWYQGESDTTNKASGASVGHKLTTFLQELCAQICSPVNFPIIQIKKLHNYVMHGLFFTGGDTMGSSSS
jgi:hypothetical protein